MSTVLATHRQALAAPWLQRRSEGTLWVVAVSVLASQLPFALVAWQMREFPLQGFAFSLGFLLQGWWLMQFGSLRRQNHPNAARLVPGQVRTLRESLVGLWLLITLLSAALPGSGLGWGLVAALLMAVLALFSVMPWLWVSMSVIPLVLSLLAKDHAFDRMRTLWQASPAQLPLFIGAMLVMGWLLCRLLQDGGAAHMRRYARAEKQQRPGRLGEGRKLPPGPIGDRLAVLFNAPLAAWRRRVIARAVPTQRSRLARLGLALGSHWIGQLVGGMIFLLIFGFSTAVAWFGFGYPIWHIRGESSIGLIIGAMSAFMSPMLGLRASLLRTRREQALLMLLPGMPRGAALNRALAGRQLMRLLPSWGGAMLFVAGFSFGTPIFWSCMAYGLACLPWALATLWCDWARLPRTPSGAAQTLPTLLMTGSGLGAMTLQRVLAPSPVWLAGLALATVALAVWRWQQFSRMPQALPAGRLGA